MVVLMSRGHRKKWAVTTKTGFGESHLTQGREGLVDGSSFYESLSLCLGLGDAF